MRIALRRIALSLLLSVMCSSWVWAQQSTANHNVILRRDPSTASPALEHLQKGARLTLVDASPTSGFYHVRTEDDQVGWVFAKFVSLSEAPVPTSPTAEPCDPAASTHVYHPQRLVVKQQCISVTGTIVDATNGKNHDGVRHEKDGDTHGWLRVDEGFQDLLNAGNMSDENGNLVFEIICRFPVSKTAPDAKAACLGYTDHVTLPPLGSHVKIVGTYVQDTFHGKWNEIHPVTSIAVIP